MYGEGERLCAWLTAYVKLLSDVPRSVGKFVVGDIIS